MVITHYNLPKMQIHSHFHIYNFLQSRRACLNPKLCGYFALNSPTPPLFNNIYSILHSNDKLPVDRSRSDIFFSIKVFSFLLRTQQLYFGSNLLRKLVSNITFDRLLFIHFSSIYSHNFIIILMLFKILL